jgi:hypothetical protein
MSTSETTRQRLINRFPDRDEIEVACMVKAAEYVKGVKDGRLKD